MLTKVESNLTKQILIDAYRYMQTARAMAELYEQNRSVCSKYVHSTSAGHEAIQLAVAFQLGAADFLYPYYRDESMLLGLGMSPYELMLQLLGKGNDVFSAGRSYYSHPSLRRAGLPTIPHQSAATGMQAIPATGAAQAIAYLESQNLSDKAARPLVVCSLGDGAMAEGEVSEALHMATLKKLPILFLVQDNEWSISANKEEIRLIDSYDWAAGFRGLERYKVNGSDFVKSYETVFKALNHIRTERGPALLMAKVPLLGHHTSGVRKEWYRSEQDLQEAYQSDPIERLRKYLIIEGEEQPLFDEIKTQAALQVRQAYEKALAAPDPDAATVLDHIFVPTPIVAEKGQRSPAGSPKTLMVDAALHALEEILATVPQALFYGQDVGHRLGGVFREAATLAAKFGNERVFNTPIQEAYIVGSTAGMSAVGAKPIVEIQFADYIWPAFNQLATEIAKSCYLSAGKFPIQTLIRIPVGAYNGGGPYHSATIETALLSIKGIKVVYPSNAADMKGLFKAAFYDPNPVIMLEHKGLYWSKVEGTDDAKTIEPDSEYIIPLGKAAIVAEASEAKADAGETALVVTYGMGVYWAKAAYTTLDKAIEIIDLRTLMPLDFETVKAAVARHGKVLVLTEEPAENSFGQALAGRIAQACFRNLDAPVAVLGSLAVPAVPLNETLEKAVLPSAQKLIEQLKKLIAE